MPLAEIFYRPEITGYSLGITIHITIYGTSPGSPPGRRSRKNNRRNQKVLIPKNSPNPPHTPATQRSLRERLNTALVLMINSLLPFQPPETSRRVKVSTFYYTNLCKYSCTPLLKYTAGRISP